MQMKKTKQTQTTHSQNVTPPFAKKQSMQRKIFIYEMQMIT